jgi:hypothetical protein
MKIRWKRWAAGVAGLLAAYTLAGFWLLPLLVQKQVPKFAQAELARQASIGKLRFNPYTLRLEAQDLRLAEADGAPLLAIGKLVVALQWRSLVRRAWSFDEIHVTAPRASLLIAQDGRFNLAELLATLERRRPHPASADTGLPSVVIERAVLEQGEVDLQDRRAGYANRFSAIEFALSYFSTLPEQNDFHTFSAELAGGGKLRWRGSASLNPVRASGELTLDNVSLPELAVYLKSYTRARVAAGRLSSTLPYTFSYGNGKFEARLAGAALRLRDLALAREGATDSFAALTGLELADINADLVRREVTLGEMRADGGKLAIRRDDRGELDIGNLMVATAGAAASEPRAAVTVNDWTLKVRQLTLDQVALSVVDETVSPPLQLNAEKAQLQLQLSAAQTGPRLQVQANNASFSLAGLTVGSAGQTPLKLARLGFSGATLDLGARRVAAGRVFAEGGQLQLTRDRGGKINLLALLPRPAQRASAGPDAADGKPWTALAERVELSRFSAQLQDQESGVKLTVADASATLHGAGSDLAQPLRFSGGLTLREGGQLSAQGSVVPASGMVQADVRLSQLALAPWQPLLGRYLHLKLAGGSVSAQGRLSTGGGAAKVPALRYVGGLDIAGLTLKDGEGDPFAAWKSLSASGISASLSPNRLDIQDLRVIEPQAILIIEDDRSFNAARLLVRPPGGAAQPPAVAAATPPDAEAAFPVRVRRLRVQEGKLDFTDLSLRPQFAAKIYALNGVVSGLSSNRESRSQIELDGRVDEFGLARIRGQLNPFAPRNNTDLNLVFRNVDLVPASPYAMKFAGYRIAGGKISLDLQYQVRNDQLQGTNQVVIDQLILGERVDSPDALKLPLELAIALLKDRNGRIDLGLPVSGNLSDPQFSYGAVIWKALGSLLTRIVAAPFRALGSLLAGGGGGERLEAIVFEPGSDGLSPPEREKLKQVAQLLDQRDQLKLTVPGQYSEAADGAALRSRALRLEVARRAGMKLEPGEAPGPLDAGDRAVRRALRELYVQRFGQDELERQRQAAERAPVAAADAGGRPDMAMGAAPAAVPLWQRVGRMIEGEPRVGDNGAFYRKLQERLEQQQPLPADALTRLGAQRAQVIVAALEEAGVAPGRAAAAAPKKLVSDAGKPVPVKLGLAAR